MSAPLAIGAVAALAALGAARGRRRQRGSASASSMLINERMLDLSSRLAGDGLAADSVKIDVASVETILMAGRKANSRTIATVRMLRGGRVVDDLEVGMDALQDYWEDEAEVYEGCPEDEAESLSSEETRRRLLEASRYFEGLRFPLEVYRGLRVHRGGRVRLDERREAMSWTPDPKIATSFATGQHSAATREPHRRKAKGGNGEKPGRSSMRGVVLTGVIEEPYDIDWSHVLRMFLSYSSYPLMDVERQVTTVDAQDGVHGVKVWKETP